MKKNTIWESSARGCMAKVLMRCFQQDERANIVWVNNASEGTTIFAAEEFGVEKRYRRRPLRGCFARDAA